MARRRKSSSRRGTDGDHVLLTVTDRGPGIAEADRGHVVERFVRLEQSRSEPGSGLGLSLVSAVAHLHGGELKFDDNAPGPEGHAGAAAQRAAAAGSTRLNCSPFPQASALTLPP